MNNDCESLSKTLIHKRRYELIVQLLINSHVSASKLKELVIMASLRNEFIIKIDNTCFLEPLIGNTTLTTLGLSFNPKKESHHKV